MKKSLLSIVCICALCTSTEAMAQNTSLPSYSWGELLDTPTAGDMANAIALDSYGNLYYLGTEGSNATSRSLTYGSDTIGEGAAYSGTSYNYNLTLLKTDKDGKLLWSIVSTEGEVAASNGTVTPLSDGSVIVTLKIRPADGAIDKGFKLADTSGNELTVEWNACDTRFYKGVIMKLSSEGKLLGYNIMEMDDAPQPGSDRATTDALDICGAAMTPDDVVYIGARFRADMTLTGSDSQPHTLSPHNIVGWNGDSQATNGDMLILALDSDGLLTSTFTSPTTIVASKILALSYDNNTLAVVATVQGEANQTVTIGDKSVTINEYASPLIISMTDDFTVNWCRVFTAGQVKSKNPVLQSCAIRVIDGDLWVTGMFNGSFKCGDKEIASEEGTTPREGMLIRLSADGTVLGATTSASDYGIKVPGTTVNCITGYLDIFTNPGDKEKIYLMGYGMNAKVGVFVRAYDVTTMRSNPDTEAWNLVTGGGAPVAQVMAYNPQDARLYLTARGNSQFTVMGGTAPKPASGYGFGQLLAAFDLPFEKISGVDEISADSNLSAPVYYNLQGIVVKSPARGLFIRKQGNKVEKVIL
ncbi:MAG: hypothetical protein K2O00_05105 [Muribaculaceae bacterium]|nr:hypothetical protein [Muribaculaceae bacterium]